ncbi:SSCRP protein [Trichoderma guizhouense]|uniref:ribonuclease T1 n=1 Tax=Trichoderma guizhouense TaxID=1491466 RepID=A0A1T3CZ16_9HYPO|nr:SSCRP protein [Trichoderma guizhouense]
MKFLSLLSLVAFVSAAPLDELTKRDTATCGKVFYSASAVSAASNAACNYVRAGSTAGGSTYPHVYNNYEGFRFKGLSKPFYEFPILSSGKTYTGGSPGADRVVINGQCSIAGIITHTGASGNAFVACTGTS